MNSYADLTDNELLRLMRTGKEQAFTEIYNRYWKKLLAIGYYHIKNKEVAEEIVDDVLVSLWLRKEEVEIQSLTAYLGTAVKFSVFKALLKEKRKKEKLSGKDLTDIITDETEKLEAKFLKDFLDGEVEKLPEKAKLVFKYSRTEHLSTVEVADRLSISPKTVEYYITKALKTLRLSLKRFNCFFNIF